MKSNDSVTAYLLVSLSVKEFCKSKKNLSKRRRLVLECANKRTFGHFAFIIHVDTFGNCALVPVKDDDALWM